MSQNTGLTCEPISQEEREKRNADSFNSSAGNLDEADGYSCEICRNKGLIMAAYEQESGMWSTHCKPCRCMKVRATIRKMKNSGLKNIIHDYTLEKFEATEKWQQTIKAAALEYSKNPVGWFFIGGQSGAGKTHICTAICREFLLSGRDVRYLLWRDDVVKLKGMITDAEKYSTEVNKIKQVNVLYIDDLFKTGKGNDGIKQRPTAADINLAFEILNFRYNNPDLITIISSECTVNDILDIDEATGGRIFERAKAFSLKQDKAKNYRLRGVTEL